MLDFSKYKPKNRSYFAIQFRIRDEQWMHALLAVAVCAVTVVISFFLNRTN